MAYIHSIADIEAIEHIPLAEQQLPTSTYAMLRQSALTFPDHPALVFIPDGEHCQEALQVTYRQLLGKIHQVANLLVDCGGWTNRCGLTPPAQLAADAFCIVGSRSGWDCQSGQSAAGSQPDREYSAGGMHKTQAKSSHEKFAGDFS